MKKLFVSVPMRDRTEEEVKSNIEEMIRIAEIVFGEKLELINSYIDCIPPDNANAPVWCLGESLKLMASADYFIGTVESECPDCFVETHVAMNYDIPYWLVSYEALGIS